VFSRDEQRYRSRLAAVPGGRRGDARAAPRRSRRGPRPRRFRRRVGESARGHRARDVGALARREPHRGGEERELHGRDGGDEGGGGQRGGVHPAPGHPEVPPRQPEEQERDRGRVRRRARAPVRGHVQAYVRHRRRRSCGASGWRELPHDGVQRGGRAGEGEGGDARQSQNRQVRQAERSLRGGVPLVSEDIRRGGGATTQDDARTFHPAPARVFVSPPPDGTEAGERLQQIYANPSGARRRVPKSDEQTTREASARPNDPGIAIARRLSRPNTPNPELLLDPLFPFSDRWACRSRRRTCAGRSSR